MVSQPVNVVPKILATKSLAGTSTSVDDDDDVVLLNLVTDKKAKPGEQFYVRSSKRILDTVSPNSEIDDILSAIKGLFQVEMDVGEGMVMATAPEPADVPLDLHM